MQAHAAPAADAVDAAITQLRQDLNALPSTRRLTDSDVNAVYALAYRDFSQARYDKALERFQLLLVYRPLNTVYMLGAALCLQRQRHYGLAAAAFGALRYLEPEAPRHILAMAECQLLNHEQAAASETLAEVIDFCDAHTGHDAIRARAQAMLELMKARHEPVAA